MTETGQRKGSAPVAVDAATALGQRLRAGDRLAAPAALNLLEDRSPAAQGQAAALLGQVSPEALGGEAPGHLIGITGPPGVGKSALLSALVAAWRARGRSVAILAIDPSSRRSGGSLLADRVRIDHDANDDGLLIRSQAAGARLGGLAPATREAAQALIACYDLVVVETVGVGQSETDVAELCDTVAVVVQPGSGDTLQFLKAGIMEVPDVLVLTKSDLGDIARRTERDLVSALGAIGASGTPVVSVSAIAPPSGIDSLVSVLDEHKSELSLAKTRARSRRLAALDLFVQEHGMRGLRALGGRRSAERLLFQQAPNADTASLVQLLEARSGLAG